MSFLPALVFGLLTLNGFVLGDLCYDTKCKNYDSSYIDCDQEYYYCDDGDYWDNDASCSSSYWDGVQNSVWCSSDESCSNDYYTGKASCDYDIDNSFIGVVFIVIVIGIGVLICSVCCCVCYCNKCCCFKGRQGRVINRNPNNNVITTPHGTTTVIQQPVYPPGQYPPAQGAYPTPAQGAYPPPAQGAYPPPAQGATSYPPAQYPPPAYHPQGQAYPGYPPPPAQTGYPPQQPQAAYPPSQVNYTPQQQPPPYSEGPNQPAVNPHYKS